MNNTTLIYNSQTDVNELVKQVNKVRLANKNNWYQVSFENETSGQLTRIKCYNTWIQLSEKPLFSNAMDMKIKEFKENLNRGLTKLINNY